MKYYIISGEASGDLHASNLIRELKKLDPDPLFRAWGGEKMQAQGAVLEVHYRELNFMGFFEVAANIFTIAGLLRKCKRNLLAFNPDVVILVDYPGFNFRIARFAHNNGYKVFYYISPQIWAWQQSRVYWVKKWISAMYVILPFEKDFYARFNVNVDFCGHPLLDAFTDAGPIDQNALRQRLGLDERPVIALLPGSRKQEVRKMLGVMLETIPEFKDYQFVIAGTTALHEDFYQHMIADSDVKLIFGQTYSILHVAEAALVTSGTATLETALIGVPQVVCYKANIISYHIARRLVKVSYISLVNLIVNKLVVKELIQFDFNKPVLINELRRILFDKEARTHILDGYNELRQNLGGQGASGRIAKKMYDRLIQQDL